MFTACSVCGAPLTGGFKTCDDHTKKTPTEGEKKQKAYSRKRGKWFEKISGRKILKPNESKKGRPL